MVRVVCDPQAGSVTWRPDIHFGTVVRAPAMSGLAGSLFAVGIDGAHTQGPTGLAGQVGYTIQVIF